MIIFKLPFILMCMLLALIYTIFKIVIITLFVCLFIWFTESGPNSSRMYEDVSFSKDYNRIKDIFKSMYNWIREEVKSI
jgi:hypothetical protein